MTVNLQLGDDKSAYALINEKPEFSLLPPGEKVIYTIPFSEEWRLDLGDIIDAENDEVSVEFSCTNKSNETDTSFLKLLTDDTGLYYLHIETGSIKE